MAATEPALAPGRLLAALAGLLGGLLAARRRASAADAARRPRRGACIHLYDGGGVTADGPALLVRKSLADKVSLSGSYYVDAVSNASIDVVTTASPFKETRNAYDLGVDYAVRDSLITLSACTSSKRARLRRPSSVSLDVAQEVFGGMTTVSLGFTRGADEVGKKGEPELLRQGQALAVPRSA